MPEVGKAAIYVGLGKPLRDYRGSRARFGSGCQFIKISDGNYLRI